MGIVNGLSLWRKFLLYYLYTLFVLLVEVLKGLNDFEVLVGVKRFLENSEVKEVNV
jgi:hypothetical protein